jgi:hypothetical protein
LLPWPQKFRALRARRFNSTGPHAVPGPCGKGLALWTPFSATFVQGHFAVMNLFDVYFWQLGYERDTAESGA